MTKRAKPKNADVCAVYLTDRAISDVLGIESYSVSNCGKQVAKSYFLKFQKALKLLGLNPDLARANPNLGENLLLYRVEKHLLVSIRIEAGLAVLTVAHANRDLETLLHELTPTLKVEVGALVQRIANR